MSRRAEVWPGERVRVRAAGLWQDPRGGAPEKGWGVGAVRLDTKEKGLCSRVRGMCGSTETNGSKGSDLGGYGDGAGAEDAGDRAMKDRWQSIDGSTPDG